MSEAGINPTFDTPDIHSASKNNVLQEPGLLILAISDQLTVDQGRFVNDTGGHFAIQLNKAEDLKQLLYQAANLVRADNPMASINLLKEVLAHVADTGYYPSVVRSGIFGAIERCYDIMLDMTRRKISKPALNETVSLTPYQPESVPVEILAS